MIVRLRSMTTVACPAEAADSMAWSSRLALSRSITDGAVTTGMPDITSTENPANVGIPAPPAVQGVQGKPGGRGNPGEGARPESPDCSLPSESALPHRFAAKQLLLAQAASPLGTEPWSDGGGRPAQAPRGLVGNRSVGGHVPAAWVSGGRHGHRAAGGERGWR